MLTFSSVPRKAERTAARVVTGEALVMVIDRRELHRLNGVGTRVFELCDGATDVEAIARKIMDEFDVEAGVARADVMQFVSELVEVGALLLEDAK
jgi:Coenzyme PQQ synthesis protein D (PqqD)